MIPQRSQSCKHNPLNHNIIPIIKIIINILEKSMWKIKICYNIQTYNDYYKHSPNLSTKFDFIVKIFPRNIFKFNK